MQMKQRKKVETDLPMSWERGKLMKETAEVQFWKKKRENKVGGDVWRTEGRLD